MFHREQQCATDCCKFDCRRGTNARRKFTYSNDSMKQEMNMNGRKNFVISAIAALSGASMLALMSPASALTLAGSTLGQTVASSKPHVASWHGARGGDNQR